MPFKHEDLSSDPSTHKKTTHYSSAKNYSKEVKENNELKTHVE